MTDFDDADGDDGHQEPLKLNFQLRKWQHEIRQKLKRFNVLIIHRGAGKLLALDTIVPTPTGYTTMGEIKVGDQVIDRDGETCFVTAVSGVEVEDAYEIEFSSGEKFICHGEHEWLTQSIREKNVESYRNNPRNQRPNPQFACSKRGKFEALTESPKTTIQIMQTLEENYLPKHGVRQKNHRVRVVPPVEFPHQELPIHPYVLGYWIGDGTTNCTAITVGALDSPFFLQRMTDLNIFVKRLKNSDRQDAFLYRVGCTRNETVGDMGGLTTQMFRDLGVIGRKHIPTTYLRASVEQRWQLLAGMMDSDGYVDEKGRCEYVTVIPEMAEDFRELICSLGIKAQKIIKKSCILDGERKKDAYRVGFKAYSDQPVFSLPRKQCRLRDRSATDYNLQRNRMIVSIKRLDEKIPMQCIEVSSPTHTYCIGRSFIPTHNSFLMCLELMLRALMGAHRAEYLFLGPYKNQMHRNVWSELTNIASMIPGTYVNNNRLEIVFKRNQARISVLGADDPESLRGRHYSGVIIDEFDDCPPLDIIWPIIGPTLTNHEGWLIVVGTPKGRKNLYKKLQEARLPENKDLWFSAVLSHEETRALRASEVEYQRRAMSADMFAQEYECLFTASSSGAYYAKQVAELRQNGHIIYDNTLYNPSLEVHCSFDIGVRDSTSVWWFQNVRDPLTNVDTLHFIDFEEASNMSLPEWNEVICAKERELGYRRGSIIFPHDIKVREWGAGISRIEQAEKLHICVEQCPDHRVQDRIELMRKHLPECRFDGRRCEDGIEALAQYREKTDKYGNPMGVPLKDGNDHCADSAGYAMVYAKQVMSRPSLLRLPFMRRR